MGKYIVTHWNVATIHTMEIIASSPDEAVIQAGYSNSSVLERRESRGINSVWGNERDKYFAGIREIYAIEYQGEHKNLPESFFQIFNDLHYGVFSFNVYGTGSDFNFYEAHVDSTRQFIHPHMVGRLLNINGGAEAKMDYCGSKNLIVKCNDVVIIQR